MPAPLGGAFHARRLTLKASQVGQVSPALRPRWTHDRRLDLALSLLTDPALDALISDECAFEDLPRVMPAMLGDGGDVLCHARALRPPPRPDALLRRAIRCTA